MSIHLASDLTAALSRVAPIHGVRIGNPDDRSTWSIDFAGADDAQKAAALASLATFEPVEPERRRAISKLREAADALISTRPIHAEKFAQALAVLALPQALSDSDMEQQFPLVMASVGIEGDTAQAVAALLERKYAESARYAAHVERTRLIAEQAVNQASDVQSVLDVCQAVLWPTR